MPGFVSSFVRWNKRGAAYLKRRYPAVFDCPSYREALLKKIQVCLEPASGKTVLEVGGIDRPLLRRGALYNYVGLDIEEKPRCRSVYDEFIVQSVEDKIPLSADIVVSVTLLEHVADNDAAIDSIYGALVPGGTTYHYVPSKWHPYSIALRMLGPRLQKTLIRTLRPEAEAVSGYRAYFHHCSPAAMARVFAKRGFQDIEIIPYYRANDYFEFFIPLYLAVTLVENACAALRLKSLSSGFIIGARKRGRQD